MFLCQECFIFAPPTFKSLFYSAILWSQRCIVVLSEKQLGSILFASFVTYQAAALYALCNCFNYGNDVPLTRLNFS